MYAVSEYRWLARWLRIFTFFLFLELLRGVGCRVYSMWNRTCRNGGIELFISDSCSELIKLQFHARKKCTFAQDELNAERFVP